MIKQKPCPNVRCDAMCTIHDKKFFLEYVCTTCEYTSIKLFKETHTAKKIETNTSTIVWEYRNTIISKRKGSHYWLVDLCPDIQYTRLITNAIHLIDKHKARRGNNGR